MSIIYDWGGIYMENLNIENNEKIILESIMLNNLAAIYLMEM